MNKSYGIFQVDAFTSDMFRGNPAAVVILDEWLAEGIMQLIAAENNLAETAFLVPHNSGYQIRWFTPLVEVDLCGHATLASAHVLFNHLGYSKNEIEFYTNERGDLSVSKNGDQLSLDFPSDKLTETILNENIKRAIGKETILTYRGLNDYLLIYENQKEIENISPDFDVLKKTDARGIIVSAPGDEVDFVSRFFAPAVGINEDPLTGSAHTTLTPYWSKRLKKNTLLAKQISERGGELECEMKGDRVRISGHAITYLTGEIFI